MQVIDGYRGSNNRSKMFDFRLYHIARPKILDWRKGRLILDSVDNHTIRLLPNNRLVAVDCAGWYFKDFGVNVQCIEGNIISKYYCKECSIEHDLSTHKPTYVNDDPILFRHPWFIRYATVDFLVNFLELWCSTILILNFSTRLIQYNHLKFKLIDVVSQKTDLQITEIEKDLWLIKKL